MAYLDFSRHSSNARREMIARVCEMFATKA